MTDIISKPWADDSDTRQAPSSAEQSLGFVCGAADPDVINAVIHALEYWFVTSGLDFDVIIDRDDPKVLTKLLNKVSAPAGDIQQVVDNNLIFPEVLTNGGVMTLAIVGSQVTINPSQTFTHRGATRYDTTDTAEIDRQFNTLANKTYHLRWQYNSGVPEFVLKDLSDLTYNATSADEDNAAFDSSYDDMLIARLVTNGSNVITATPLQNKHSLFRSLSIEGVSQANQGDNYASYRVADAYAWARTPKDVTLTPIRIWNNGTRDDADYLVGDPDLTGSALHASTPFINTNRYELKNNVMSDYTTQITLQFTARS